MLRRKMVNIGISTNLTCLPIDRIEGWWRIGAFTKGSWQLSSGDTLLIVTEVGGFDGVIEKITPVIRGLLKEGGLFGRCQIVISD